jgi:hypothetical protein
MQRTVHKVIEGQKIVESEQIIEYERPKIISGRYLGTQQAGVREVMRQDLATSSHRGAMGLGTCPRSDILPGNGPGRPGVGGVGLMACDLAGGRPVEVPLLSGLGRGTQDGLPPVPTDRPPRPLSSPSSAHYSRSSPAGLSAGPGRTAGGAEPTGGVAQRCRFGIRPARAGSRLLHPNVTQRRRRREPIRNELSLSLSLSLSRSLSLCLSLSLRPGCRPR